MCTCSNFIYFFSTNTEWHTATYFFSGFLFATAKVASITTMIYFHITLHPTVHVHDFHNYIHNFTQLCTYLANRDMVLFF